MKKIIINKKTYILDEDILEIKEYKKKDVLKTIKQRERRKINQLQKLRHCK